jgi:hypothetical protein
MEWCCAHQTNEAAYCFYNYVMCPLYTVSIAIPMKLDAPKVIFFCIDEGPRGLQGCLGAVQLFL